MCGIYLSIGYGVPAPKPNDTLRERLKSRGPDSHDVQERKTKFSDTPWINTRLEGTVLALRGEQVVRQPVEEARGLNAHDSSPQDFLLCWNGEAWAIDGAPVANNDTTQVFKMMRLVLQMISRGTSSKTEHHVLDTLARIRGPYAFTLLDMENNKVYFARDCLGRRSLLFRCDAQSFELASVGDGESGCTEVESNSLYVIDFGAPNARLMSNGGSGQQDHVIDALRLSGLPFKFPVLPFSWSAELFETNRAPPSSDVPKLTQESESVGLLEDLLRDSLKSRLATPSHDARNMTKDSQSRIAVLFSGGLDCSVLARLAHDQLPINQPIDLLNVAFHNPRVHGSDISKDDSTIYETCPDRMTARASLAELQRACPGRQFRLIEVNVPYLETQAHRSTVASLLQPHDTEMDLSIGLALYFAARGEGMLDGRPYKTASRVLISGLGADELFGGYQRHATAFDRGGFATLVDELALDTSRLGKRNLGRDDRVIAHWGREARYPYLDEGLVAWAAKRPVWEKCGFGQKSEDVCDVELGKLVLRLLAQKLGLPGVAREKKRAIQFGARTAKMEKGGTKGTDAIMVSHGDSHD